MSSLYTSTVASACYFIIINNHNLLILYLVVLKLLEKIKQGDSKAITLYLSYVYGKPTQTINQTTSLTISDVDISDLISFKKTDENE